MNHAAPSFARIDRTGYRGHKWVGTTGIVNGTDLEDRASLPKRRLTTKSTFRYVKTSSEIILLAVLMYPSFSLSLHNFEDPIRKQRSHSKRQNRQYR